MELTTAEIQLLKKVLGRELSGLELSVIHLEKVESRKGLSKPEKDFQIKCLGDMRTIQDLKYKIEKEDLKR